MKNIKDIKLQAHMGVASECPANTMPAFRCAAMQAYDVIELDLQFTKDKKIVVLHDNHINRTARNNDGSLIQEQISISDITYEEVLKYDFGVGFSNKYKGTEIPLFEDVLKMAADSNIHLKIDNKIRFFDGEMLCRFFDQIKGFAKYVSITSDNIEFTKRCMKEIPEIAIDYDGEVTEDTLKLLSVIVPQEQLTVWLPYKCKYTHWVKIPFADKNSAELVKRYAKLGIWLISDYKDFYDAAERFQPDIVETDGTIKPIINVNSRFDMHTHSKASHDSQCDISDMQKAIQKNGLAGFAVTDHCDIEYYKTQNIREILLQSTADAAAADKSGKTQVLCGVEIGEGFWYPYEESKIINEFYFDVIVGSVHAVRFENYSMPYSQIDFSKMDRETVSAYMDSYFDDMLCMINHCDIDVLAHLTCPLRYINGKYGLNITLDRYMNKIECILKSIIERGIALEINTSCVYDGSGYCEFMPNAGILKMYRDMGGYLITTGSDAHTAQNAANRFDELYSLLKESGFKNTYYFKNRYAIQCAIK